jgi:general secretion pathway protein L
MREILIIRLSGGEGATWCVTGGEKTEVFTGPIEQGVAQCEGRQVILLVPGADVLLCQVDLPGLHGRALYQALPFALEDELAGEVETLHFALGGKTADGEYVAGVVSKRRMDGWLAPFREQGVEPDAIYPETLGVPWERSEPPGWAVLLEDNRVLVRTGAQTGFACEPAMLGDMLALAQPPGEQTITVHARAQDQQRAETLGETLPGVVAAISVYSQATICLAQGLDNAAIDLRQGDYSIRSGWERWGLPFRATAILLVVWFAVHMGSLGVRYMHLSHQHTALQTQARQTFRQMFPHITRIEDLRAQAQSRLNAMRRSGSADAGLFYLLQKTAQGLENTPKLRIENLQYRNNALYLRLHGSDLGDLETLRKQFSSESGVKLEVQSANSSKDGVQMHLRIGASA